MVERGFVDALIRTLELTYGADAVVLRPNDGYTLGIPDILCWRRDACPIALEAKQIQPLMPVSTHRGRRTGQMLKHPFSGPQISMLRRLERAGVAAFGIVRVSLDTAYRIKPADLPARTGNFTYDEMVAIGTPVYRRDGRWLFLENQHGQVSGAGHRDDPGDGAP